MNRIKVLMTTVGGLTSPDIIKAIKENNEREIELIGVDPFKYATGRFFTDKFEIVPNSANDELSFVKAIDYLVGKYDIDIVIPCGNEDNLALAKYREKINAKIMVGQYDDLVKAYDKGEVYEKIRKEIPEVAPEFYIVNSYESFISAIEKLEHPRKKVVIKPRFGRGGRGVYVISSNSDFKSFFGSKPSGELPLEFLEKILSGKNEFEDLIVMEYLEDPYYSVYSLCENGRNLISINHIREWGNASQTFRGLVYYDQQIEGTASEIIKSFNLTYTNNIELATNEDNRMVIFDLNPRIGASSGIDRYIGLNFPYLAVKMMLEEKISIDKSKFSTKNRFIRYFTDVWMLD